MAMNDVILKIAAIAFSLLMLACAVIVKKIAGHWAAPGCIFSFFWFLYSLVPLALNLAVPIEPLAILYILAAMVAFAASTPLFNWKEANIQNLQKTNADRAIYSTYFLRLVFKVSGALAMIALLANSYVQQITIGDMVSNFFGSSAQYVGRRYSGELRDTWLISVSNIFSYLAATLGGLTIQCVRKNRERLVIICVAFLPSAFVMVTQSARGMMFLAIAFFFAGNAIVRLAVGDLRLPSVRTLGRSAVYLLIIVPLIAISFMAKGLHESQDWDFIFSRLHFSFISYISGHLFAFSDWFSFYIGRASLNLYAQDVGSDGFFTFMAIFKAFGSDREIISGVYEEYYTYADVLATNIYTMFRGLILDFGVLGSLVAMAAGGLICNASFYLLLSIRRPCVNAAFFVCIVGFFYTSFIISLMIWNSVFVLFALLSLVLWLNSLLGPRRQKSQVKFI
jgi:oligosaccharide repeat unit polymerase